MDNLRGLLGIRKMDKIRKGVVRSYKGEYGRIDEGVLRWISHCYGVAC